MKKISAMLLAVCMLFGVSACGKTDTIQADTADLQTRTGYIVIAEDGLHFDAVEVVTKDDTEKIKELRLEEMKDYPNGFAIVNQEQQEEVFTFADDVQFQFVDTALDFIDASEKDGNRVYQTNQIEEFLKHLGGLNDIPLSEQTIPYTIILKDGKVINVIEELQYTI